MSDAVHLPGLPTPPVRATCAGGPRPCPWISCRHQMTPAAPAKWPIPAPTCALDVADLVEAGAPSPTLDVVGRWLGVTRERVRQIEATAKRKAGLALQDIDPELPALPEDRPADPARAENARRNEDEIVSTLREHRDWVEVRVLARRTGLTRRNVRIVIRRLRNRGTPIESRRIQGGGYRLARPQRGSAR